MANIPQVNNHKNFNFNKHCTLADEGKIALKSAHKSKESSTNTCEITALQIQDPVCKTWQFLTKSGVCIYANIHK